MLKVGFKRAFRCFSMDAVALLSRRKMERMNDGIDLSNFMLKRVSNKRNGGGQDILIKLTNKNGQIRHQFDKLRLVVGSSVWCMEIIQARK